MDSRRGLTDLRRVSYTQRRATIYVLAQRIWASLCHIHKLAEFSSGHLLQKGQSPQLCVQTEVQQQSSALLL